MERSDTLALTKRGLGLMFLELVQVTELRPFGDNQVDVLVERSAVGRIADAVLPIFGRETVICALFVVWIIADLSNDGARFVEHGDAALEFGDHEIGRAHV